jgi:hypothetical protein
MVIDTRPHSRCCPGAVSGLQFGLSIPAYLKQKRRMENENDKPTGFQGLVKWAMTPPQAYAVYLLGLILIYGLSFIAGTLNPKKAPPPPAVSVPRS